MDSWEYMTLQVEDTNSGPEYVTVNGPQYARHRRDVDTHLPGDALMRLLDDLGGEGWELISLDAPNSTYWLKKRTELDERGVPLPGQGLR